MHIPRPDDDRFYRARASRALLAAMEELAQRSGCLLPELEGVPMAEAFRLAETTYGPDLPEFWQIWKEWQEPPDLSTLGEL